MDTMKRNVQKKTFLYVIVVLIILFSMWKTTCQKEQLKICEDLKSQIGIKMDDPYLVDFIRICKMTLPSRLPYQLNDVNARNPKALLKDYFLGARNFWSDAVFLAERLIPKEKQTKRFFECGASDGEFMSQTYFAERFLGWTGILVEADPFYSKKMTRKNRKATQFELCASTSNRSSVLQFLHIEKGRDPKTGMELQYPGNGAVYRGEIFQIFETETTRIIDVFCVPVYTMLLAANALSLDIFFLDVEGAEMDVLRTIPFDKVDIAIFVVEHQSIPNKLEQLEEFFLRNGYILDDNSVTDALFIKLEYTVELSVDTSKVSFYKQVKEWSELQPKVD